MRTPFFILLFAAALGHGAVGAQPQGCVTSRSGETLCPAPDSKCAKDLYGDWHCSPPGGDVTLDRGRTPVCGPGQCVVDLRGDVYCSSSSRGAAALDRYSEASCAGGCVRAQAQACTRLAK